MVRYSAYGLTLLVLLVLGHAFQSSKPSPLLPRAVREHVLANGPVTSKDLDGRIRLELRRLGSDDLGRLLSTGYPLDAADLSKLELPNQIIATARLASANLTRANLAGSKLYDVDLTDAVLDEAMVARVLFKGCSLEGVSWDGTSLAGSRFVDCDFSRAVFQDTNLTDAVFVNCRFTEASFKNIHGLEGAEFIKPIGLDETVGAMSRKIAQK